MRGYEVLGAAGRTELEAVSPACAGVNRRRGPGEGLPFVLLAAGCSEGFVCEQRKKSYRLSTSMGWLRLPVALAGRRGFEGDPV